jgi:hypothetical protein
MSDKTLLVIEPRVKLTKAMTRAIEEGGFVVVRGTPSDFHVVGNHPPISDPLVLKVALETIQNHTGTYLHSNQIRWQFAKNLAEALGYGDVVEMRS